MQKVIIPTMTKYSPEKGFATKTSSASWHLSHSIEYRGELSECLKLQSLFPRIS